MKAEEDMTASQLLPLMKQSRQAHRASKALRDDLKAILNDIEYGLQFSAHASSEFRIRYKARRQFEKKEATK